jgi:hypothetical protein
MTLERLVMSFRSMSIQVRTTTGRVIKLLIIGFILSCFKTVGAEIIIEQPAQSMSI